MAFLDFIKNRDVQRPAAEQQSQQQKPDHAREHFARRDAQDKAALKPLDGLPAQPKAELDEVKARMEKASQHLHQDVSAPVVAPQDSASSPEAARQNMSNQEKATPELSPTSMQAGTTVSEKDAPAVTNEAPVKEEPKPTPTPDPSPTPTPRGRDGWER
jgi:hypothetical protein